MMAYRGEDLDLRTPQTWVAAPAELSASSELPVQQSGNRGGYRSGPILVDETVLACCNYAYDVALANRSVRCPRRTSSQCDVADRGGRDGIGSARRSGRGAAARNGCNHRERDPNRRQQRLAIAAPIRRARRRAESSFHRGGTAERGSRHRRSDAGPSRPTRGISDVRTSCPIYLACGAARRPRPAAAANSIGNRSALRGEPGSSPRSRSPRGYRGDFTASPTDAIQNSRIEALEQMVRALNQELSNERHAALLEARGTNSHEPLVSKLESIEAALEFRLQEMSQSWSVLSQRLQELEASVRERAGSGDGPTIEDIREAIDLRPISLKRYRMRATSTRRYGL